jgi:hypothetical protein
MIDFPYSLDDAHAKIFYKTCDEFEEARAICLQEDNWLKKNYTKDNLVIEDHLGYGVVYKTSTGEPMVMGGLYQGAHYPSNTARMLNRTYIFPKFRSKSIRGLITAYNICHEHIIFPLIAKHPFECYFITMQNRDKETKGWWNIWKLAMSKASGNYWTDGPGYIQTCPWNVQKCWQNFVYHGHFNMPTISQEDWASLPKGD